MIYLALGHLSQLQLEAVLSAARTSPSAKLVGRQAVVPGAAITTGSGELHERNGAVRSLTPRRSCEGRCGATVWFGWFAYAPLGSQPSPISD
jgi:hypothetical protein